MALYREEARHRGESGQARWSDAAIVERILEHNLHGIDLDPRAVQIAAAALWLKARQMAPEARIARMNLVASHLRLASLPDDDAELQRLRREVEAQTGVPGALTDTIVHALRGADHLGSLLKVDAAVDEAIELHERQAAARSAPAQTDMFAAAPAQQGSIELSPEARRTLIERLEDFLAGCTGSHGWDCGLSTGRLLRVPMGRGNSTASRASAVRRDEDVVQTSVLEKGAPREFPSGKADFRVCTIEWFSKQVQGFEGRGDRQRQEPRRGSESGDTQSVCEPN
jgi:hypothetical protein